ncbi:MAG: hypothetical protein J6D37_06185 [Clostridia bacterium]|nr:hypothetical protein [Clostridia bacterium]
MKCRQSVQKTCRKNKFYVLQNPWLILLYLIGLAFSVYGIVTLYGHGQHILLICLEFLWWIPVLIVQQFISSSSVNLVITSLKFAPLFAMVLIGVVPVLVFGGGSIVLIPLAVCAWCIAVLVLECRAINRMAKKVETSET